MISIIVLCIGLGFLYWFLKTTVDLYFDVEE